MPSPSTSTLSRPSASRSSLSHSITVRSSIVAFSIGTTWSSGVRVMTKPPTCCDRWRGKPCNSRVSDSAICSRGSDGIEPDAARLLLRHAVHRPAPQRRGQRRDGVLRQPERLADFAHRAAAAIADHGRGHAGMIAAIGPVDMLDHLLAPLVLEIDVDIRRLAPLGRDEALEQRIDRVGADIGDAEAIADHGIRRRAAALTQDRFRQSARVADDVVHGQEERRIAKLADDFQFVVQDLADIGPDAVRESPFHAGFGERDQPILRRVVAFAGLVTDNRAASRRARSGSVPEAAASARSRPDSARTAAPFPAGDFRWRSALSDSSRPAWSRVTCSRMQVTTSCSMRRQG